MYDISLKTFLMDCNVISISLKTGNQSAYIFALQSQLVSLQVIMS